MYKHADCPCLTPSSTDERTIESQLITDKCNETSSLNVISMNTPNIISAMPTGVAQSERAQVESQLADDRVLLEEFGAVLPDGGAKVRERIRIREKQLKRLMCPDVHIDSTQDPLCNQHVVQNPATSSTSLLIQTTPPRFMKQMPLRSLPEQLASDSAKPPDILTVARSVPALLELPIDSRAVADVSRIPDSTPTEQPLAKLSQLTVELMVHQKQCLSWMLNRERRSPSGGILADDMGLGKTISVLALIVVADRKNSFVAEARQREPAMQTRNCFMGGTLVVAPVSLMNHWAQEVKSKVRRGTLSVYVYHGPNREHLPRRSWERVVLDEAHVVKNHNSRVSKACCLLDASSRWCVTGTPVHNDLWDLFSLIRFLRARPYNEKMYWREYVMSKTASARGRLGKLLNLLLLRRTKDQKDPLTDKPIVSLKPRVVIVVEVAMTGIEKDLYLEMEEAFKYYARNFAKDKGECNGSLRKHKKRKQHGHANKQSVLVMLLRMRQAADHMFLAAQDVDFEALRGETLVEIKATEQSHDPISLHKKSPTTFRKNGTETGNLRALDAEKAFTLDFHSAKLRAILQRLCAIVANDEKCVIVSQWTAMLTIIEHHLRIRGIRLTSVTGAVPANERQARVDSFNKSGRRIQVMLLSLTAGGVGLNLTGANHLFVVDPHWNPALEQQACDRVYRLGQDKPVFIHKFICVPSIEQKVLELQEKKRQLAEDVLGRVTHPHNSKLTEDDLDFLLDSHLQSPFKDGLERAL